MARRETAGDPEELAKVLAGLRAYQVAPRPAPPPLMPVVRELGGTIVHDYGGQEAGRAGAPVLLVPSLINPPSILDLDPDRSFARWLAGRGYHVLLLDWGPAEARRDLDLAGHVEQRLLPIIREMATPPVLIGYCLGGTMALAAATRVPVRGVITLAAPWRFSGYAPEARARLAILWATAAPMAQQLGFLPMEVLQTAFWSLDPARTVAKYAAFADMPPHSPEARAFVRLEDWANGGEPLPYPAARELFEDFFGRDVTGRGNWLVEYGPVSPKDCHGAHLALLCEADAIVPSLMAPDAHESRTLAIGHVGIMASKRAQVLAWTCVNHWLGASSSALQQCHTPSHNT